MSPECPDPRTDRYAEEVLRRDRELTRRGLNAIEGYLGEQRTEAARQLLGLDPAWVCPECAQGKHANCDGTAWDFDADEMTACGCSCRGEAL